MESHSPKTKLPVMVSKQFYLHGNLSKLENQINQELKLHPLEFFLIILLLFPNPRFTGLNDGLGAITNLEFAKNIGDMITYCFGR